MKTEAAGQFFFERHMAIQFPFDLSFFLSLSLLSPMDNHRFITGYVVRGITLE
jgi:hypothetical protein